ncbi:MAG: DNA polymerase Y family protein, partial [Acidimicrobiales bacterium]
VGIAEGRFAASLAARRAKRVAVVERGGAERFVAPFPVATLERRELSDLLVRLGVRTLGELAALPAPAVLARFGVEGVIAHRLARGLDEFPLVVRTPPPELAVVAELESPAESVEEAAFVGKALADELAERLDVAGLACSRVLIRVQTVHGEEHTRSWRFSGELNAAAVAQRVRWQLEGWMGDPGPEQPTGGLSLLAISPEEVHPSRGEQLALWGGSARSARDDQVVRALARVQGLLGPEGVTTAVLAGGRDPVERARVVPWGDPVPPAPTGKLAGSTWPGRLPAPAPAVVHHPPGPARVLDPSGDEVEVTARGLLSGVPATVSVCGGPSETVAGWAGPWPVEGRWWEAGTRRRARLQVCLIGGSAYLLAMSGGSWWVDATYD